MRGSVKWQVQSIYLKSGIKKIGESNTRDVGIYSYATADAYRDIWQECFQYVKTEFRCWSIEALSGEHIKAYLEHKIRQRISRSAFQLHVAALKMLGAALNGYADKEGTLCCYRSFYSEIRNVQDAAEIMHLSVENPADRVTIKRILDEQLRKSGLNDLDFKTYVAIADYASKDMGVSSLNDITKESLQEYLSTKAKIKLNRTRRDKVEYVLSLIIDWNSNELSKKCAGISVSCDYCGSPAKLVRGRDVPEIKSSGYIYLCINYPTCDAYVGVHSGDNWPKGRLSNAKLRELKKQTHTIFDKMWQNGGFTRTEAYKLLQEKMELKDHQCHIAVFDDDQCKQAISICKSYI